MSYIKTTFILNRRNKLKLNGKGSLELCATLEGKRKFKYTGIDLLPKEWDAKNQRVKGKKVVYSELNARLQSLKANIEIIQNAKRFKEKKVSLSIIDELFQPKASRLLIDFVSDEIDCSMHKTGTINDYKNTLNHLKSYPRALKTPMDNINFEWMSGFHQYLVQKGLGSNTVHKIFKNLRMFLNRARKKNLLENLPNYRVNKQIVRKEILTLEQLEKLENLDFKEYETTLEQIRDMFLFGCYTGLRISDVIDLKWSHLKSVNDEMHLDKMTVKVNKLVELNLSNLFLLDEKSRPVNLVNKYKGESKIYVFPKLASQTINKGLKTICLLAEIDKNLTFKSSRDFFGTFMSTKVATPLLMRLMQHSDIKTTMIYVSLSSELINEGLLKVDWE